MRWPGQLLLHWMESNVSPKQGLPEVVLAKDNVDRRAVYKWSYEKR